MIATARVQTTAPARCFFDRWADMPTWTEWNADTEWVKLDGPFVQGATGTLKPKGGPKVPFVVAKLVPGERFTDVSKLWGARLTFDHRISRVGDLTTVEVGIEMTGPLRWLWIRILGAGLRASAQRDLDALVVVIEGDLRVA